MLKVIGMAFAGVMLALLMGQQKSEYSLYIAIAVGVLIFLYISGYLQEAVKLLQDMGAQSGVSGGALGILFKVMGIAYLTEFSAQLCKDAGHAAIAMKVELAGKLMILVTAIPIFSSLAEMILSLLQ
ncbi:MAG: stage III sporulation protein AD [Firmicutes bacterium]|nr:stage III sporulation protein AD [Bacillota bacterium]